MDVALVAVISQDFENHSVAALREALDDAGLSSVVVPFLGFAGMGEMLDEVVRIAPRVCGVSLQTTESLLAALAFTRLLRGRGFGGTIVVGGHVATLCADTILAAPAGVDVVVELAGEDALVGIARGEDPRTLPGTRTRDGAGLPARAVVPRARKRERISEHLGVGVADLVASRGCAAHCGYCCVSAVSDRAEATGAPRTATVDVATLAREIADAARDGARAIHLMDDNLLPLDPDAALAWVLALRGELVRRRVPTCAFSLQLRADVVTAALADALAELGLVRAYVGIDGYTAGQLRAIGRSAPADAGARAVTLLRSRGIYCVANALIVGPTLALETVAGEIDGLARIDGAPVHLLPIEARPGTVYHRRATSRGLIEGGPLWPVYRFEDPRTFLVGEVLTGLPTRLVERSVPIALYDLAWALGVAQRLAPAADVRAAVDTYARVTAAWNADQLRVLRAAVEAARAGDAETTALLARELPIVRAHDERLLRACDDALVDVERAVSAAIGRPVRAHARGRLLGVLGFTMGLAAAACEPSRAVTPDAAVDAAVDARPDALPVCADPSREGQTRIDDAETCACGDTIVSVSFDVDGIIRDIQPASGTTLSAEIRDCLRALFDGYCYPSLAATTKPFMTCHNWIA